MSLHPMSLEQDSWMSCLVFLSSAEGADAWPLIAHVMRFLERDMPTALFIALFFILPLAGFPISLLLIAAGVKFGSAGGILAFSLTVPLHLLACFGLSHSLLRPVITAFLARRNIRMPIPLAEARRLGWAAAFLAVPSVSYSIKNYLLALSGLPFRYYFGLGWIIHTLVGLPFIILGESASENVLLFFAGFILLSAAGYGVSRWIAGKVRKF